MNTRHADTGDHDVLLRLTVPAGGPVHDRLALPVFLVVWAWGLGSTVLSILEGRAKGSPEALAMWLLAWCGGGALALFHGAWILWGQEVVSVNAGTLSLRTEVLGHGFTREYELARIRRLRVEGDQPDPGGFLKQSWDSDGHGLVAFDYGFGTVRFGAGLGASGARRAVEELRAICEFAD